MAQLKYRKNKHDKYRQRVPYFCIHIQLKPVDLLGSYNERLG